MATQVTKPSRIIRPVAPDIFKADVSLDVESALVVLDRERPDGETFARAALKQAHVAVGLSVGKYLNSPDMLRECYAWGVVLAETKLSDDGTRTYPGIRRACKVLGYSAKTPAAFYDEVLGLDENADDRDAILKAGRAALLSRAKKYARKHDLYFPGGNAARKSDEPDVITMRGNFPAVVTDKKTGKKVLSSDKTKFTSVMLSDAAAGKYRGFSAPSMRDRLVNAFAALSLADLRAFDVSLHEMMTRKAK